MKRPSTRALCVMLVLALVVLLRRQSTVDTSAGVLQRRQTETSTLSDFKNASAYPVSLHMDRYNICRKGEPLVDRDFMLKELPRFISVYEQRPDENHFGTKFAHQFAMWCAVRKLKPRHIIESGIFRGLGTWLLRRAAPDAQLILLDPKKNYLKYRDKAADTVYLTAENFKDFEDVDWSSMRLDRSRTLVYFDDHQSGLLRTKQAYDRGFPIIMFDDNYSNRNYDHLSLKIACYVKLKHISARDVNFKDNFSETSRPLKKGDVQLMDDVFDDTILQYMEFPLPWSSDDVHNNTLVKNNNENNKYRMKSPNIHFLYPDADFYNVCLVKLRDNVQ